MLYERYIVLRGTRLHTITGYMSFIKLTCSNSFSEQNLYQSAGIRQNRYILTK